MVLVDEFKKSGLDEKHLFVTDTYTPADMAGVVSDIMNDTGFQLT